ncbi:hypothetical protein EJ04DRAFT_57684 [Polyplosphaeria fusca]|uniref:Uncharacterized protein n=1 Tax=Polyplosphaeria fusca TaxID=682080 RepID=A0A9P4QNT8_9PLEO|nr:hypothetical protein EJ04DRAFT_57684 [Polyplosphaeria fusca]
MLSNSAQMPQASTGAIMNQESATTRTLRSPPSNFTSHVVQLSTRAPGIDRGHHKPRISTTRSPRSIPSNFTSHVVQLSTRAPGTDRSHRARVPKISITYILSRMGALRPIRSFQIARASQNSQKSSPCTSTSLHSRYDILQSLSPSDKTGG